MIRKTTILGVIFAIFISMSIISGCSKSNNESLIGKWKMLEVQGTPVAEYANHFLIFESNGIGNYDIDGYIRNFTWSTSGDSLTMTEGSHTEFSTFHILKSELRITYPGGYQTICRKI